MTAKDIITPKLLALPPTKPAAIVPSVTASTPLSLILQKAGGASMVKVFDDNTGEQIGTIESSAIINAAAQLFPAVDESCELIIECNRHDYSASIISRAVEDCNAHVLNLNVRADNLPDNRIMVALRINHLQGEAVARSLARYGYDIIEITGSGIDSLSEVTKERINELIHYLEL